MICKDTSFLKIEEHEAVEENSGIEHFYFRHRFI